MQAVIPISSCIRVIVGMLLGLGIARMVYELTWIVRLFNTLG